MKCPYCGAPDTRVVDSRSDDENNTIKRRRVSPKCSKKFTTYEYVERPTIYVIKKDGRREPFDPDKIMRGLVKACEKRPVSIETLENITTEIKERIEASMEREVESSQIGEYVMDYLKRTDDIAYVRFASVYRQFKDINGFLDEIQEVLKKQE